MIRKKEKTYCESKRWIRGWRGRGRGVGFCFRKGRKAIQRVFVQVF